MRDAIAAMAALVNDLIVDEVVLQASKETPYHALLSSFDVRFVGLFAPLDVLEARERERGDRTIGLARWPDGRVHRGITYDFEIDTTMAKPPESARIIQNAFGA